VSTKPVTPYQRLIGRVQEWVFSVKYPHRPSMFSIPKAQIGGSFTLTDVYERAQAANQLGYDVVVLVDAAGALVFQYRKRPGEPPMEVDQ
jgi:hypothetical protein